MTNIIEVHYDTLDQIAARFQGQAEGSAELDRRLRACLEALEQGGWIGLGADAFFGEMRGTVLPAMQRFTAALCEAQAATLQIRDLMRHAEEEAARLFGGDGANTLTTDGGDGWNGSWGGAPQSFLQLLGLGELEVKGSVTLYDLKTGSKEHPSKLGMRYAVSDGELLKLAQDSAGHWRVDAGSYKSGFGADIGFNGKGEFESLVGLYGEFSGLEAEGEWLLAGDQEYGVTADAKLKAFGVDALVGWNGERVGASVGVNLVSVEGQIGGNIAGVNVGVTGEIGLKAELGLEWDGDSVEVKFPFFSLGIGFGGGKDGKVD